MSDFLRKWWPAIFIALVVFAFGTYANHLRRRASFAEEERDVARMEAAGANAAHEATARQLRLEAARLTAENSDLSAEVERLRSALPGASVVGTTSGTTGVVPVSPGVPPSPTHQPCPTVEGQKPGPACVLTEADSVEVRVNMVTLQGDSGAVGVAGTAEAWRAGDSPAFLARAPLKMDVKTKSDSQLPGWGAGAVVVGGRTGWWLGPLLSPPPIRVFGLEGSLLLGAGVGGGGEWGGLAGGLLRW